MLSKAYKCPKEKFPYKQTNNNTHPRRGKECVFDLKKPLPSSSFIIHISILLIYYKKQKDKILTV